MGGWVEGGGGRTTEGEEEREVGGRDPTAEFLRWVGWVGGGWAGGLQCWTLWVGGKGGDRLIHVSRWVGGWVGLPVGGRRAGSGCDCSGKGPRVSLSPPSPPPPPPPPPLLPPPSSPSSSSSSSSSSLLPSLSFLLLYLVGGRGRRRTAYPLRRGRAG